jgi:hypothetical protein
MKIFIAVLFFCQNGDCAFWKGTDIHYSVESCAKALEIVQEAAKDMPVAVGTCLPVTLDQRVKG